MRRHALVVHMHCDTYSVISSKTSPTLREASRKLRGQRIAFVDLLQRTLYSRSKPSTAARMTTQNPQPHPQPNIPRDDEDSRTARVLVHLKDSFISQLTKLDPSVSILPHHSFLIQCRLQQLFRSFHTPTHPAYSLMICSAITELDEGTGSTEEAISEFIKREYNDLPWAHSKILSLQLEKLCEFGEIARAEGGRYVQKADGEEREQCSEERKRDKRRSNSGDDGARVEQESEEKQVQVFGKQSQHGEAEAQGGLSETRNQDSMLHSKTTCFSRPTTLKCVPSAKIHESSKSGLDAAAKMSGSLSLNVQECKQDQNPMTGCSDHRCRERKPCKCKQIADNQGESLLSSGDATVTEQEPDEKKIDERCLLQLQGRGTSRGRDQKLHRNAHCINKKLHPQVQAEDLVCSSYSNQKETSSSSQPAAPNSPVNPTHNSGQQLVVPTSEGSPECIVSIGKLPPTSDIDLGTVSKRKASLTCENVDDDQPQHYNQASSKGNLDEIDKPMSRGSEQKPPKRPRGRPPKIDTRALLPSDDDIHNEQKPNINKMEMQHQYGKGRGGLRRGRGQGGPPKLNQNAEQCEEQLEEGHQYKQRGRGRGRGRPPKLNENPSQYEEESPQEDQAQQHGRGRGRGRPPKLVQNTNKCEAQLPQEVQAKQQHVRGRGRGRPRKVNKNTNQCEEQLQSQDEAQSLVNCPSSGRNDNQSLERHQLCHHKSESGEAKPPAGLLRLGSKSTCGSGEVPQSNVEANQSCWRLQPVTRRVQGGVGCRFPQQNQN
ncbi:hypothetical protein CR513_49001, partial [Mucuna pruriens]